VRLESHQEKRYQQTNNRSPNFPSAEPPPEALPLPLRPASGRKETVSLYSQTPLDAFSPSTTLVPPPLMVIAYNRMGFGLRPGDIEHFNSLGANDDARFTAYVDEQLSPDSIDDTQMQQRLENEPAYQTLNKSLTQLWTEYARHDDWWVRRRPAQEVSYATFLRATHSKRQLAEVLTGFWHNHFNVYGWDDPLHSVWVHYDRDVIRPHILGNFRQMLEANAKSTAMLFYLDQYVSSSDSPNENYAREVMELHTLGADNYLGAADPASVPKQNGIATAFVENDVKEVARALTGWSFVIEWLDPDATNLAEFTYRPDVHDNGSKQVLGVSLPAAQADLKDAQDIFDILAAHPGTARYICKKLCRRFISDNPPDSLVESAATIFQNQWQAADQLQQVMRHILLSDAFKTTFGEKVKQPFETIVSTMRAVGHNYTLKVESETGNNWLPSDQFEYYSQQTGHHPFTWGPPNGFPDKRAVWQGTNALAMSWRAINHLVFGSWDEANNTTVHFTSLVEDTLDAIQAGLISSPTPNNLAVFWSERVFGYIPDSQQTARIAALLTHPNRQLIDAETAPDWDIDTPIDLTNTSCDNGDNGCWPYYWRSGLRAMVSTLLMSPEFLRR